MGGGGSGFPSTLWSQLKNAKTDDEARRRIIIGNLTETYWKPIYSHLRRKGYDNEKAKDLTQGFFQDIVLGRKLILRADRTKGKFRTFLLSALKRYVAEIHRAQTRRKRFPEKGLVQLEWEEFINLSTAQAGRTPEEAYCYAWAADVIDYVIDEVKKQCLTTRSSKHWLVFWAKILQPIINNSEAPSHAEICAKYDIRDESTASNMITTVKRRFRDVLKRRLRELTRSDSEAEEEFLEIFRILSGGSAG
jgi:RNA polymerase sigma-70 factor (ECF subfamily)